VPGLGRQGPPAIARVPAPAQEPLLALQPDRAQRWARGLPVAVKWDQHNPEGRGKPRVSSGWMDQFLARTAERQAKMLDDIFTRLERDREKQPEGLPSKEHMRAARFAQDGFRHMMDLKFQAAKLELDALRLTGRQDPMSDEVYQAKLEALGDDALDTAPVEKLEAALARRRALVPGG
jgi:hypothetical protein